MNEFRDCLAGRIWFGSPSLRIMLVAILICRTLVCQTARAEDRGAHGPQRPVDTPRVRQLATLANADILESSGIAASLVTPNLFWTHNDSGDGPRLFAFNEAGADLGVVALAGITAIDWEDMASFRRNQTGWLLVADVGDNARRRETCQLHLLPEPGLTTRTATAHHTIHFRYEGGPRDCEAVGVDGASNTVLLVSKAAFRCEVFALTIPAVSSTRTLVARSIAVISIPFATALDISPDGERAIVLTYADAYEFQRRGNEPWAEAFKREPRVVKMPPRRQGEAICYAPDGRSLYLTSEKWPTPLWKVERTP
ncbi:MAG: hypothetical protein WD070_08120 [Pirellulaceae bacterium]